MYVGTYCIKMTRRAVILLMVLIFCVTTSLCYVVRASPKNNSLMGFPPHIDVSMLCTDENEVEWKMDICDQARNSIQVVSPNEKILRIVNITGNETGVYRCMSKKNPSVFVKIIFHIWEYEGEPRDSNVQQTAFEGQISLKQFTG